MKSIVVFWCFCIVGICYVYAIDSNRVDSLLLKLDQSIKKRPIYMEQKELRLAKLRRQLLQLISEEEHFAILGALLDEYRSFNTDSAFYSCRTVVEKPPSLLLSYLSHNLWTYG